MRKNELNYTPLEIKQIPINEIVDPQFVDRSEKDEEKLLTLMNSIQNSGLLNPVWVRKVRGKYERIAGSRRIEAHKRLGLENIDAKIFRVSEEAAYRMAWLENMEREKLPPIDELKTFLNLIQLRRNAKLKQAGETIEHIEPIFTFAANLYKVYSRLKWDNDVSKSETSPEFQILLDALIETCEREGVNVQYFVSKLRLISLPTRLLAEVNRGKVSLSSALEALSWRDRILGKLNKQGEHDEARQRAFEKLIRYIIEEQPTKTEVKAYAQEILSIERSKMGIEQDYKTYRNSIEEIQFQDLNNQQKIKVVNLMKKIDAIVRKNSTKKGKK